MTQDWVLNHLHGTVERCLAPGDAFQPSAALKGLDLAGRHLGMFGTTLRHAGHDGGPVQVEERIKNMSIVEKARHLAFALGLGAEAAKKVKEDADTTDG